MNVFYKYFNYGSDSYVYANIMYICEIKLLWVFCLLNFHQIIFFNYIENINGKKHPFTLYFVNVSSKHLK